MISEEPFVVSLSNHERHENTVHSLPSIAERTVFMVNFRVSLSQRPAMARIAIISAANSTHFPLLLDLIASIRNQPAGRNIPICVLDVGLTAEERARIQALAQSVVAPGWDLDFPGRAGWEEWFKAMVSRPFLPRHFPGYDMYLWLDADIWVQDWRVIDYYLAAAGEGKLAAVATIDRTFATLPSEQLERRLKATGDWYNSAFGPEVARRHYMRPAINCGAFALAADAPHWRAWQENMAVAIQRWAHFILEQTVFNYIVYEKGLPFACLPMYCNWMCNLVLPKLDIASGDYVEPEAPHERIGLVHLSGMATKDRAGHEIAALDGSRHLRSLRYGEWLARRRG